MDRIMKKGAKKFTYVKKKILPVMLLLGMTGMVVCGAAKTEAVEKAQNAAKPERAYEDTRAADAQGNAGGQTAQNDSAEDYSSSGGWPTDYAGLEDWRAAYLEYLKDIGDVANYWTYSLIYVNEDEIPELAIDTRSGAGGVSILTCKDGVVDEVRLNRSWYTYLERENLLCNSGGHMDYYADWVFMIQDGKWVYAGGGTWNRDDILLDENGEFLEMIYVYFWKEPKEGCDEEYWWDWDAGEEVDEDTYHKRLAEIYDLDRAMEPGRQYILSEMRSLLWTGEETSAGHSYELVAADVSWTEAQAECEARGGYLAAITSLEELARIQEQIIEEGYVDVNFWVGAKGDWDTGFGFQWNDCSLEPAYRMTDISAALGWDIWWEDEPSYDGVTETGEAVMEHCVALFYEEGEDRCYLSDMPDDILAARPSFAGRIGYICEYDHQ